MKVVSKQKLTRLPKDQIWEKIYMHMKPDDRDPLEVINNSFNGDVNKYLKVMKKYQGWK